jgi:hypothetical protein
MEFGSGQEGTGRTGGPITGWVIGYDGSFDAAENWQNVLDVDVESSSRAGEAEPLPMAVDVAMEMLNVDGHEGMAAIQAAQVLEKSFEAFDKHARQIRRQDFQKRVQQEFLVAAEHLPGGWSCGGGGEPGFKGDRRNAGRHIQAGWISDRCWEVR